MARSRLVQFSSFLCTHNSSEIQNNCSHHFSILKRRTVRSTKSLTNGEVKTPVCIVDHIHGPRLPLTLDHGPRPPPYHQRQTIIQTFGAHSTSSLPASAFGDFVIMWVCPRCQHRNARKFQSHFPFLRSI